MGWQPNYQSEARIYSKYIQKNFPGKTVGILYQNDDFGKDYLTGFHDGFGKDFAKTIVAEVPYEVSAPTVDSLVVQIKDANPDIFVTIATPKFAAQAIKKIGEMNWHPVHFLTNVAVSVTSVLKPAGFDYSQGILSAAYLKDPNDPQWKNDPGMLAWHAFMTKWYPEGDQADAATVFGYGAAMGLEKVLRQCGNEMTRANLMKQLQAMDFDIPIYLPGIHIKTSPTDRSPMDQLQMMRFKGESWELFGPMMEGSAGPS
jgi:ABC-type branched-subunit amino acid transport system substrate-binding protein